MASEDLQLLKHADVSNFNKTDMVVMKTSDWEGESYRIYGCIRGKRLRWQFCGIARHSPVSHTLKAQIN